MPDISIPYVRTSITELELDLVRQAQLHPNPFHFVDLFEQEYARWLGRRYAVATSSCTGALTLGYASMGLGPGDEIIMADSNWIATLSPAMHLGVRCRLVDIEADSWCIDPRLIKPYINDRTRAIVATHLFGNLADITALQGFEIPIIEDAAEAIGSRYHGRLAGSLGLWAAFSFHNSKTFGAGEGGMFVTDDADLYQRARLLNNHGRSGQRDVMDSACPAFKFKMTNMQAAQGLAQLQRASELIGRKQQILGYYRDRLSDVVQLNAERMGCEHGGWYTVAVFPKRIGMQKLLQYFREAGIDTRQFFSPLSDLSYVESADTPIAHDIVERAIKLPSFHDITQSQLDTVIELVRRIARESDRS